MVYFIGNINHNTTHSAFTIHHTNSIVKRQEAISCMCQPLSFLTYLLSKLVLWDSGGKMVLFHGKIVLMLFGRVSCFLVYFLLLQFLIGVKELLGKPPPWMFISVHNLWPS
jgi:hypothetical protein